MTGCSFELLGADEDKRFRLAPYVKEILADPSHPRFLGGYVQLGTRFATEDYRLAVEAFQTASVTPFQGRSQEFAQAIAVVNVMVARKILPELPGISEILNAGGTLLEIGCATRSLLLQIARSFPGATCVGVVIDPSGLIVAREAVLDADLDDRVTLLEGDIVEVVNEAEFDAVVMVEVVHEISPDIRPSVVKGCARALRQGGHFVTLDETYPSTLAETRQPDFLSPVQTGMEEMMWGNIIPTR